MVSKARSASSIFSDRMRNRRGCVQTFGMSPSSRGNGMVQKRDSPDVVARDMTRNERPTWTL